MIYIEKDITSCSLFKVEEVGGRFTGWTYNFKDSWEGYSYGLYPDDPHLVQAFLAPSVLDRW